MIQLNRSKCFRLFAKKRPMNEAYKYICAVPSFTPTAVPEITTFNCLAKIMLIEKKKSHYWPYVIISHAFLKSINHLTVTSKYSFKSQKIRVTRKNDNPNLKYACN